ncbi:DUF262 domain-containing protein [Lutibacter sp. A80]|uniref:GmrSD restriction endonuclease domain-containing protein n=1 Tax=Lutibacter sp. A80 TaxID=2918453 RepID=UPI001F056906|nr:DUF262 domain-containing protein [Lutibacter sp. A80]UMB59900.1 DUF262 domain-containing protein [Lutibacter sp. A80]
MKNVQKPEKIHLGKLIKEIGKGRFVIPDFQREFDWEPWDVRDLIKSIFSDYYIGTLLLWEGNKETYKKMGCANLYAYNKEADPEYIVLDGQQRLSALHYAFFQPDVKFRKRKSRIYYFLKVNEFLNENYEEMIFYYQSTRYYDDLVNDREMQFEEHIFNFGIMQEGSWEIENWIKGYKNYWEIKAEEELDEELKSEYNVYVKNAKNLKDSFEDILDNYQVSYISLSKELELNKVCDIFTHINSKGKPLDTFDLLNSITRKEDIYLKDMYREASKEIDDISFPGFEMKTQILMVMSILKQNYCSAKYLYYLVPGEVKKIKTGDGKIEEQVLITSKQEFINSWEIAVNSIDKTLKSLKNPREFGAITSKFLPYPSIIPALSAIKTFVKNSDYENKADISRKIKKWYWASIFLKRYSSSVETSSAKDFIDLKKWFSNDDLEIDCVSEFIGSYKTLDLQKEANSGSAIYRAVFNLIIINGARDWDSNELPEYDDLDDHHIVPKSWGKKMGIPKEINSILNRAPLSGDTNRNVLKDQLPNVYLKNMLIKNDEAKVYEVLASHLISKKAVEILLREDFTVEDYYEFLLERKETIINQISKSIIDDSIELPEDLQLINNKVEEIELSLRELIINTLNITTTTNVKELIPPHILEKINQKLKRERKRNPALVEENIEFPSYWLQFLDLQELLQIITSKVHWEVFKNQFGTIEKLNIEFNDMANLRNALRHSREVDRITKMKGEASLMWLQQQLKI